MNTLQKINHWLNTATMYKLVFYGLSCLVILSIFFGFIGLISYSGFELVFSAIILLSVCYGTNRFFSFLYKTPKNPESPLITALILFLIILPANDLLETYVLIFAGITAMASKYIVVWNEKHPFNPAVFALVILDIMGRGESIWWIGNSIFVPAVIIIGFLVLKRIRKFQMFGAFAIASLLLIVLSNLGNWNFLFGRIWEIIISWPFLFFGAIMLTEPLTTPSRKKWQIFYGAIVGILFVLKWNFGPLFSSPEISLLIGNVFSFIAKFKK
jgi:Na+-translocating ferredoxin:NAD+ oxidoreductase RnfD subunit